jgi:hypothetical protein
MQSLQLHLTSAARSWLRKLAKETIGSWDELTKQFTSKFRSTYKRPASLKEVKACTQKYNESLRSYIQRWSITHKIQQRMSPTSEQSMLSYLGFTVQISSKRWSASGQKQYRNSWMSLTNSQIVKTPITIKERGHPTTTGPTGTTIRGENLATMTTTALTAK